MSAHPQAPPRATLADLMKVDGKAELIGGKVVTFMPTGRRPGRIAGHIYRSLDEFAERTGRGEGHADGVGYAVPELPSGRESFCPDASYYTGPEQDNPDWFIEGPPDFAVEVRSENDSGPAAEREMAAKRADYFAAGTLVVWDVDPVAGEVRKYTPAAPDRAEVFTRGQDADAEPAVPGWRLSVEWLLR
jgi:Uma2 family endonuclease